MGADENTLKKKQVQEALLRLDKVFSGEQGADSTLYSLHRRLINSLFNPKLSGKYDEDIIMKRLILIDSLYSTNAAFSYFSIEEMAKTIKDLGDERASADYFYALVEGAEDTKLLFTTKYGIQKDLSEGRCQPSLLSKYAYYLLMQDKEEYPLGFPIYDSLAQEVYQKVHTILGIKNKSKGSKGKIIEPYIQNLNELRGCLWDGWSESPELQVYDLLDTYLWRIGKIDNGNLSLVLSPEDYREFVEGLGLKYSRGKGDNRRTSSSFETVVKEKCREEYDLVVKAIKNECLRELYEHWYELYRPKGKS